MINSMAEFLAQKPKRGRGKPKATAEDRERHLDLAIMLLTSPFTAEEIAARFEISRACAYRWLHLALGYEGPRADLARGLARLRIKTLRIPSPRRDSNP